MADLVVVVAEYPDAKAPQGFVAARRETGMEGSRPRAQSGQDRPEGRRHLRTCSSRTSGPVGNLIGEENKGFYHLMRNLPAERLGIAIHAAAQARRVVKPHHRLRARAQSLRTAHPSARSRSIAALAQMKVEVDIMTQYIDQCILAVNAGL